MLGKLNFSTREEQGFRRKPQETADLRGKLHNIVDWVPHLKGGHLKMGFRSEIRARHGFRTEISL